MVYIFDECPVVKLFYMKYLFILSLVFCLGCSRKVTIHDIKTYDFPSPVNTESRPIQYQEYKIYHVGTIHATNDFPSGRLNDFTQKDDSTYQATISAENTPINHSPWYAFKLWSETKQKIRIELNYTEHFHRYYPKISKNGENWIPLDSSRFRLVEDSVNALITLELDTDTLWVAAQEIQDYRRVGDWVQEMGKNELVRSSIAGKSPQGRSLYHFKISKGSDKHKPTIIIISRQHPPEVTGYLAMQAFVETIIKEGANNGFLAQYNVMVYPLMNPDGVDLGHYRHNTGGVDLNRDWAYYHQPEIKQVVNHMVNETNKRDNEVVLGLDFHSTWKDVYYTMDDTIESILPDFTSKWLDLIKGKLYIENINEQPSGLGSPVSKGWFYQQFKAESITYEIGDNTPRDFIKVKGEVSARAMMELLMKEL